MTSGMTLISGKDKECAAHLTSLRFFLIQSQTEAKFWTSDAETVKF